ncbi:MAG: hypothetical protein ACI8XC_004582 [Gammaproteobacteria bacterium]|jgi:hypothetical protein
MSLQHLNSGDFVSVHGLEIADSVVATVVKRRESDEERLEGTVEEFLKDQFIQIRGIKYGVNPFTEYDSFPDSNAFFDALSLGDVIEITDEEPSNGFADEVEIDD